MQDLIKVGHLEGGFALSLIVKSCGTLQVGPKRRRLQEDDDILGPVQRQEVQEATLVQRLNEYVDRIDTDMVMRILPLSVDWNPLRSPVCLLARIPTPGYAIICAASRDLSGWPQTTEDVQTHNVLFRGWSLHADILSRL